MLELVLLREATRDLSSRARALLHQDLAEAQLRPKPPGLERPLELLGRDHAIANEERSQCRPGMPRGFHHRVIGRPE